MITGNENIKGVLAKTIQHNCHIADAKHAGDYTLCIYLLKMRELYRWEQGVDFTTPLESDNVGAWLKQREQLWEELEEAEYKNIQLNDLDLLPFESDTINKNLKAHNLVYSGGMGINNRPHFFLAELDSFEQHQNYTLYIAGKEYARDMAAPPAMSHQNNIYIRKESFRRLLWEKLETWRWNKPDNALGRAFACYDCDNKLEQALDEMTDVEVENVIQHERGEIQAGELLGEDWHTLLYSLPHSKTSLMLRAIRDLMADHLSTLPNLLEKNHAPSLHFYFGNLTNLRKDLAPKLMQAYQHWFETDSLTQLEQVISTGQQHWPKICHEVLNIYHVTDPESLKKIQIYIEEHRL